MPDDVTPSPPPEIDPAPPSPRAFATTTGFVLQIVGLAYFLGGAFYWFISGRVQGESAVPVDDAGDYFAASNMMLTVTTMNILAAVAGGLAMIAFGVGLQGEKRLSGIGAMITMSLLAAGNLAGVVVYVAHGPAWIRMLIALAFAIVNIVLFLLAGYSASLLKQYPPPEDQNVVDDAWLDEYHRSRRAGRGH